jgi:hypothetical protein
VGSCREAAGKLPRRQRALLGPTFKPSATSASATNRALRGTVSAVLPAGNGSSNAGSAPVVRYIKLATVAASSNAAWTTTFQVLGTVSRGQESHAFDATVVG